MEEKRDAAYFKGLAQALMFDLSDAEAADIVVEFETLTRQLELLEAINTDGVEPLVFPFEQPTAFMREDVVDRVITQKQALANAANVKEGYVVVPVVVKQDGN